MLRSQPVEHSRDDHRSDESIVVVDYKPTPFGVWTAVSEVAGYPPRRVQATDAHQVLHAALDELKLLADQTGRNLGAINQLDGDPEAWAQLAADNDFDHCAVHDGHGTMFLG